MSTPLRLAAFAAALVVVFGLAFGAGAMVDDGSPGPDRPTHTPSQSSSQSPTPSTPEESHDHVD